MAYHGDLHSHIERKEGCTIEAVIRQMFIHALWNCLVWMSALTNSNQWQDQPHP